DRAHGRARGRAGERSVGWRGRRRRIGAPHAGGYVLTVRRPTTEVCLLVSALAGLFATAGCQKILGIHDSQPAPTDAAGDPSEDRSGGTGGTGGALGTGGRGGGPDAS